MRKLWFIVFVIGFSVSLYGQNAYTNAKAYALDGNYDAAIELCENELKINPINTDFINLNAWIYSLQSNFTKAIELYQTSLSIDDNNYDALEGLIRNYQKITQYKLSLQYCNKAIANFAKNTTFLLLKAQSLKELNQSTEALYYIDQLLSLEPANQAAKSLRESIKKDAQLNKISIGHIKESYQDYYNTLRSYQVQYMRTTYWGTLGFRVQQAQRESLKGYLYELESYPRYWKGSYGYINLAISNKTIFPEFRYGFDLNQNFLKTYGIGIGIRSLHFKDDTVNLLKLTAEKYFKSLRLEATVYKGNSDYGNTYTYLGNIRKYFDKSTDYAYITFGNGISPDNQGRFSDYGTIYKLKSKQLMFGAKFELLNNFIFYSDLTLINNELPFDLGTYVEGKQFNIGYQLIF